MIKEELVDSNYASGQPAYVEISDKLREAIRSHELRPGDKLPAERLLVEHFGVARMTLRHALDLLQMEGLIERRRGRTGGTFVRQQPPVVELLDLAAGVTALREAGHSIEIENLDSALVPLNPVIAEQLGEKVEYSANREWTDAPKPSSRKTFVFRQRLSLDGTPAAIVQAYCPVDLFPELASHDPAKFVLPHLEECTGRARANIAISVPSATDRKELNLAANMPLLSINRVGFGFDDKPAYVLEILLRSDVVMIELRNEKSTGGGSTKQG
ncbi:GntR family transcriptional regulator [Corynebacterium sp. 3HC-13]|uniref:GntR family transcriptional regulator n=1 Tax=Corynebacterium poyangense TaxID=2684405 RepID=UPI001CCE06D4|nr:GntR family transcriptional regulator [Corynebacterium poyangense]MBZ8178263.1 GntR family transcriptional regulator [Corynebacterium poyangense]